MRVPKPQRIFGLLFMLALAPSMAYAAFQNTAISISLNRTRPQRGETVEVTVQGDAAVSQPIQAVLLQPTKGTTQLVLQKVPNSRGGYRTEIPLGPEAPEGIYVIHVWTGEAANPSTVGKATFLLGRIVAD